MSWGVRGPLDKREAHFVRTGLERHAHLHAGGDGLARRTEIAPRGDVILGRQ